MLKDFKGNLIDFNDEKLFPPKLIEAKKNPKDKEVTITVTVNDLPKEEIVKIGSDFINKVPNNKKKSRRLA